MTDLGIYVHIPFCRQKCAYCDFTSYTGLDALFTDYTAALCLEIAGRGGLLSRQYQVDTVYVGGGTPTLLPTACLVRILDQLRKSLQLTVGAEISIEANPGTIDREKLMALRAAGFNRISFGVQSFVDPLLCAVGRIHTAQEAVQTIAAAQDAGFANVNVDLMYGLPGQTEADFRGSLHQAAALEVAHICAYGLKVEEGTPLATAVSAGRSVLPDEDAEVAMYELATSLLPERGYPRYEISNYAQPKAQCRHNGKYWRYQPYLGFGAAACSFMDGRRSTNTLDVGAYIQCMAASASCTALEETPDLPTAMAEFTFLALRTVQGLSFAAFYRQFGRDFVEQYRVEMDDLEHRGLLLVTEEGIRLTERGMKFGNVAFLAFLPENTNNTD